MEKISKNWWIISENLTKSKMEPNSLDTSTFFECTFKCTWSGDYVKKCIAWYLDLIFSKH